MIDNGWESLFWHDPWMRGMVSRDHLSRLYNLAIDTNVTVACMVFNDIKGGLI